MVMLSTFSYAQAQHTTIEIPLSSNDVSDIQSIPNGDSLFVAVDWYDFVPKTKDYGNSMALKYGYWIDPSGNISKTSFGFIEKAALLSVECNQDTCSYYYLKLSKKEKKNVISRMASKKGGKQATFTNTEISFLGDELIALTKFDSQLVCLSFDSKTKKLHIKQINQSPKEIQREMDLSILKKLKLHPITYIDSEAFTSIGDASSMNKLFYENGKLIFISVENNKTMNLITLNLETGEETRHSSSLPENKKLNTFYHRGIIYSIAAISNSEYLFTAQRYGTDSLTTKIALPRLLKYDEFPIYVRHGKLKTIKKESSLFKLMNIRPEYHIAIVLEERMGKPLFVFGDFLDVKGTGFGGGIDPLTSITIFLITSALRQTFGEGVGISRYSYLEEDANDIYKIVNEYKENPPIRQRIDDYEIAEQKKKKDFEIKLYRQLKSGVASIYHVRKESKLRVVKHK